MKKLFVSLYLVIALIGAGLAMAGPVSAVELVSDVCTQPGASDATLCADNRANGGNPIFGPDGILTTVMGWLAKIIGVMAVFVVIVGGFKLITSGGDSNEANTGRQMVIYALIALVIAALAQAIVSFVLSKL